MPPGGSRGTCTAREERRVTAVISAPIGRTFPEAGSIDAALTFLSRGPSSVDRGDRGIQRVL